MKIIVAIVIMMTMFTNVYSDPGEDSDFSIDADDENDNSDPDEDHDDVFNDADNSLMIMILSS